MFSGRFSEKKILLLDVKIWIGARERETRTRATRQIREPPKQLASIGTYSMKEGIRNVRNQGLHNNSVEVKMAGLARRNTYAKDR